MTINDMTTELDGSVRVCYTDRDEVTHEEIIPVRVCELWVRSFYEPFQRDDLWEIKEGQDPTDAYQLKTFNTEELLDSLFNHEQIELIKYYEDYRDTEGAREIKGMAVRSNDKPNR